MLLHSESGITQWGSVIAKKDSFTLLESGARAIYETCNSLQIGENRYYKVGVGVTKQDIFIEKWSRYYKVANNHKVGNANANEHA